MASQVRSKIGLFMLSFFFFLFTENSVVTSIPTEELDAMLSIVRARGYNLFSNAITTSDLQLDLLTAAANASFTFFAPTDSSLFALAMTLSAPAYTATLRYHGLPRRLSVSDLNRLPSQVPIPTLLPSQNVSITRRRRGSRSDGAIFVNGVNVVLPGLFYGSNVAVHGLAGILVLHSHVEFLYDSPPSPLLPFPPQIDRDSKENLGFAVPPADREIGHPAVSPSNFLNKSVDLPLNRVFLGPAPERLHLQVQSPPVSSVSPSVSPVFPPPVESDLTPPMKTESSVTPPVPSDLTPPKQNETSVTPPPPVSSDLTPPMQNETSVTPPPISRHLTPPLQDVNSVTPPPPSVSSDLTPLMQDANSMTPPPPVSSDLTPPMQDANSMSPPLPVSSDLTPPMQDVNSMTPPLRISSDMTPPIQDVTSVTPPVSSDMTLPMQNINSVTPPPMIGGEEDGEAAWMTKPEGDMSGRTVKEYEPSDWMSFGFNDGNSNHVHVEDSHFTPNMLQRV